MNTENHYSETDLGNISIHLCGEYDPQRAYEYLDAVEFGGGSYICAIEYGKTITGIAPEPTKNTEYWHINSIPGTLTPEYIAMHDRVVNISEQVEADAEEVRTAEQNVSGMELNVIQMHEQTRQSAEAAEQSKDSSAGYAASADASRQAAEESEQNINAHITGFDIHVAEKTEEAENDIEAARIAANKAIIAQQEQSVNEVARAGIEAISTARAAAQTATEKAQAAATSEKNATASETAAKLSEENATKMAEQVATDKEQVAYDRTAVENAKQEMTGSVAQIEQNTQGITELKSDLTDVQGVFPQKVNNNYCTNEVDQYGSTLYQPVYLEKGCVYKVAHVGSTEIGGATLSICGKSGSGITYFDIITTNYFYPNGHIARQNFAWNNDTGWYRLKFAISAVFTDEQKETYKTGWVVAKIEDVKSTEPITKFVEMGTAIDHETVKHALVADKISQQNLNISCIGDSLTYGYGATVGSTDYPSVLQTLVMDKTVYNLGVAGEATDEILARQGGYPAVVSPFTIPADTTAVEITFADTVNVGSNNTSLLRKSSGNIVNPVIIDGVKGSISLSDSKYWFSRTEAGTEHEVKRPQYVVTKEMREHKDDIQIIFVGTNGGWMITTDDAETRIKKLTSQIDMMIDYNTSKKYIVIGLHYFYSWVLYNGLTKESLENAMKLKYGNHYINLRKYMIEYGLSDAGLSTTEADITAIENGEVPPSLLYSDGIHGNAAFYNILANLVHKKGIELGYW